MNQISTPAEALNAAYRKFCNTLSPELKLHMNGRLERGLQIALTGGVHQSAEDDSPQGKRRYIVNSANPARPPYHVDLAARTCSCPDHWNGHYCKHRVAAQVYEIAGIQPKAAPVREVKPANLPSEVGTDREAIIWACVRLDGKMIGVEVLGVEDEQVRVQALPGFTNGGKLEPQFPFPNGGCTRLVQADDLIHVRVYRGE